MKAANWLQSHIWEVRSTDVSLHVSNDLILDHQHKANQMLKHAPLKYDTLKTGSVLRHDACVERELKKLIPDLQKVQKSEESDFILGFLLYCFTSWNWH